MLLNLRLSICISKKVVDKGLILTNNIVTQLCSAQVAVERKVFQSWNDQSLHKLKRIVNEEFVFIFFSQNIFSNSEYSGQKNIRKLVRFFSWFVKAVTIKFSLCTFSLVIFAINCLNRCFTPADAPKRPPKSRKK